jgi:branched-chain amino acid transport system permease protein
MRFDRYIAPAAFTVSVLAYPLLFSSSFALGIGITVASFAAGTIGFVLLLGLAHQLAIGQAAFYMVGGYATSILTARYGWDALSAAGIGALAAAIIAYAVGKPILKLHGFVLAIASFLLQLLFIALAVLMVDFTGGASGIPKVPRFSIARHVIGSDLTYYLVVWGMVAALLIVAANIDRSRMGRALRALAANEPGAAACGIDTTRHKLQIFVVSAVMASLGGSALVHYIRVIDPTVFGLQFSLDIITAVIVGGLHSIWGGVLGAGALIMIREMMRALDQPSWEVILMGALTAAVLIGFPSGLAGMIGSVFRRLCPARPLAMPSEVAMTAPAAPAIAPAEVRPDLLCVSGAARSFGSLRAVDDVSFNVATGQIVALIGPNGAGKTTMLDMISGHQGLDSGSVAFRGDEIGQLMPDEIAHRGVARTFQNVRLFDNMTVLENVMCGRHRFGQSGAIGMSLGLPRARAEEQVMRSAAMRALRNVGLEHAAYLNPTQLSFGHQRMVEMARAQALDPTLILLDEPASGLNDSETEALAQHIVTIRNAGTTVLLVEHDIRLVMGLADWIVVMDRGRKIAEGTPEQIRADPQVITAYLGAAA